MLVSIIGAGAHSALKATKGARSKLLIMVEIRILDAIEGRRRLSELADVLVECVEAGASVSFVLPFSKSEAESFFRKILDEVSWQASQ